MDTDDTIPEGATMERTFDSTELARWLRISTRDVMLLVRREALPSRRVRGRLLFRRSEVIRWSRTRMGDDLVAASRRATG